MLAEFALVLSIAAAAITPLAVTREDISPYSLASRSAVNDDDKDQPTPTVAAGLGNGGTAADSLTLLIETIEKIASDVAGATDGQGGGSDPQGVSPIVARDPMAGLGQVQDEEYCGWASLPTPLDAGDPAWGGNTAADGQVKWKSCAILDPGTPGAPGNFEGRPVELQFFPNAVLAAAAVPPPPDPRVIAQRAIRQLQVPAPRIGAGPDRAKLAVNLWTWLWIDGPGPMTATAVKPS